MRPKHLIASLSCFCAVAVFSSETPSVAHDNTSGHYGGLSQQLNGSWCRSWKAHSREEAGNALLNANCIVLNWFYGQGWGAVASDANGNWGVSYKPTANQAEAEALNLCGSSCVLRLVYNTSSETPLYENWRGHPVLTDEEVCTLTGTCPW